MATPIETVTAFFSGWTGGPGALQELIAKYFTPETVWETIGSETTYGIDQAIDLCNRLENDAPPFKFVLDWSAIAADGDMVLSERIDHYYNLDGSKRTMIKCMAICQVRDGKIVMWRDYFNHSDWAAVLQAPEVAA